MARNISFTVKYWKQDGPNAQGHFDTHELIQIAVGSLYMFSVPRGYLDGFMGWMRQVIGLCLTAFLQSTILVAGLMVFKDHALMGVGLMLSAGEVPRIAGSFGLDTTTKANITSAVYTAQSAVNVTRTIAAAIK